MIINILMGLILIAILAAIGFGIYYAVKYFKDKKEEEQQQKEQQQKEQQQKEQQQEEQQQEEQQQEEQQQKTGFDAVIYNSISNMYYFIKDNEVWKKLKGSDETAEYAGTLSSVFGGLTLGSDEKLDAALFNGDTEKYYFFSGNSFWEKDYGSDKNISVKKTIAGNWDGQIPIPMDAALYNRNSNKYYFFSGTEVWEKELGKKSGILGYTKHHFGGFEVPEGGIEGALYNHDTSKYYFFNKGNFWTKDSGKDEVISGAQPIAGNWGGLYDLAKFDF